MSLIRNIAMLLIAGTVGASAQQKPAVDTAKIDAAKRPRVAALWVLMPYLRFRSA